MLGKLTHHFCTVYIFGRIKLDPPQNVTFPEKLVVKLRIALDERVDRSNAHAVFSIFPSNPVIAPKIGDGCSLKLTLLRP